MSSLLTDLASPLKEIPGLVLALARNRLELLALELREEETRLVLLLIWTAVAATAGLLTILMATFTVIFLLDADQRPGALIAFTLFYLLLTAVSIAIIIKKIKFHPPAFSQTIAEFKKDRECL